MGAADNFFTKAEQALKKRGGLDYAIELFQQGLAIDPDRLEERQKLRAAAVRRCQENGGNTLGSTAVKLKNGMLLGKIKKLGVRKQHEEQIVEIEKFLAIAPQNPDQNVNLARAFEATERMASAAWAYQTVVEVDPKNTDSWKQLGRLREREGDLEQAIACWERVRSANPGDQEAGKAIRDLSAATMMKKADERKSGGDGSFRDLLKDEDESAKLEKKGALIRTEDDAKTAVDLKREEVEKDADNPRQWRELGDLYMKHLKDFKEAEKCYRKAMDIDPHDMYASEKLGGLQESMHQHQVEQAKIAYRKDQNDAAAKTALENALREQQAFLVEEYKRRVEAHPTDFGLKYKYGSLLVQHQRWDEAIAQFQQSRKDPKFAVGSHFMIGRCFFQRKLYDLAIKEYGAAIDGIPENDSELAKEVRYYLAEAHQAKGDKDRALELLEEIMSVDINYQDVSKKVDEIRGM